MDFERGIFRESNVPGEHEEALVEQDGRLAQQEV